MVFTCGIVSVSSDLKYTVVDETALKRDVNLFMRSYSMPKGLGAWQILGALKAPFGEEIPNYDGIYRDAEKLLLEGCSVQYHIAFWRHRQ